MRSFRSTLAEEGFCGLLVPSFAPGTSATDCNLVLLRWGEGTGATLTLVDDEQRLR